MPKSKRRLLILIAMLGVGMAVTAAGSSFGAAVTQRDSAAKAGVIAAFRRLNALPGYRIRFSADGSSARAGVIDYTLCATSLPQGDVPAGGVRGA